MRDFNQQSLANTAWAFATAGQSDVSLFAALAEAAMAAFLQRGGWQEGYGYHQGEDAESRIEIYRSVLDAPMR